MLLRLYRFITGLSAPVLHGLLWLRQRRGKEDARRYPERRGQAQRPRPEGRLIWLHGASVGESLSALALIEALLAQYEDLHILVTTGTVTSARLLAHRLPDRALHQFIPLDHPAWVQRFLDHWQPDAALWMESEFWPNLLYEIRQRRIPAALVNARISEKSLRNWQRAPDFAREILSSFALCHAQAPYEAEALRLLGAEQVEDLGNLKYASASPQADETALATLRAEIGDRPVWLFSSTHPGEEELALRIMPHLPPDSLCVMVPRHPDRGAEIRGLVAAVGLPVAQRSQGESITPQTQLYIADTLGEMGLFLRCAPICVIGGSFVPHGGHNPIEPAQLDCAILHGPHMFNFRAITAQFHIAEAALECADETALATAISDLFAHPERREVLSQNASHLVAEQGEILPKLLDYLRPILSAQKRDQAA